MTVPQDTVLCAGLGLLPALLGRSPVPERRAWTAFLVGWVPLSAVLLLAWPAWSFMYVGGPLGDLVGSPGLALGLGLGLETAAFAGALRWSRTRTRPTLMRTMTALSALYVALLVLPLSRWTVVGPAEAFAAGTATPIWTHVGVLAVLGVGGLWLLAVQAIAWRRAVPLAVLLLVGCGSEPEVIVAPPPAPATVAVAHDAHDLVDALSRGAFGAAEDGVQGLPVLRVEDEGAAYAALIRGDVDAAIVLREPGPAEKRAAAGDALLPRDPMLQRALARDAVVLAVGEDLGVTTLAFDDAVSVIAGARADWGGLGGSGPVQLLAPARGDSARALVVTDLLGGEALSGGAIEFLGSRAVIERLRTTPGGVGVVSLAAVRGARPVSLRTPDGLVLEPRVATKTGDWPLVRPVLVVTQATPHAQVEALLAFAGSPAGAAIIRARGMEPPTR